jgi:hypothetical protein
MRAALRYALRTCTLVADVGTCNTSYSDMLAFSLSKLRCGIGASATLVKFVTLRPSCGCTRSEALSKGVPLLMSALFLSE